MRPGTAFALGLFALGVGVLIALGAAPTGGAQSAGPVPVPIDADDIGGVVTGPSGPRPASG